MLQPFRLHEPTTVGEASGLLARLGDEGRIYAGGTELLLAMKQGLLRYSDLVNIKRIGLDGIAFDEAAGTLRVGATTTHRSVERSPAVGARYPMLAAMERHLANVRVRAVGTVGGNLSFAEPHSDLATVLLLYGATVRIGGASGPRVIGVAELLVDAYTTSLAPDELLLGIDIPALPAGAGADYRKFAFFERPSVGAGAALIPGQGGALAEARVAVGCVGPVPRRVAEAESALAGVSLRNGAFERAASRAAEAVRHACDPVDDLYGSAEYKRHLAGVLTERALAAARDRILARGRHGEGRG
ncbi:MAG TPA: xanthine dehydrogenase family protein subunit M [bacterium]|nr:xanthine dehydrogenase family protein subunit M [bacterium]